MRQMEVACLARALRAALAFLGQNPPARLDDASIAEVWAWARAHWRIAKVPRELQRRTRFGYGAPSFPPKEKDGV
jgi:hypothetical protein